MRLFLTYILFQGTGKRKTVLRPSVKRTVAAAPTGLNRSYRRYRGSSALPIWAARLLVPRMQTAAMVLTSHSGTDAGTDFFASGDPGCL